MDAVNAADAVRVPDAARGAEAERAFLLARGFTAVEAARLVARKREAAHRRPTDMAEKRLLFARWLVAHGRLHEGGPGDVDPEPDTVPDA
jgi:hypothetical protein